MARAFGREILVSYKKVKYLRIKISRDGVISVSSPLRASRGEIESFIFKNEIWVKKTLEKIAKKMEIRQKESGKFYFLGREFGLNFGENFSRVVVGENLFGEGEIWAKNRAELDKFLLLELKKIVKKYIEIYAPNIAKNINRVSFRHSNTRWGSCNHKKGYLNFSFNLIYKDERFIEYVVLHELTHLIYPHHQKSFYDFIAALMPDFKARLKL